MALPVMIVTGASGFVGRNFLESAREDYTIYALARRSQLEAGIAEHPNIRWIQVDIANWSSLKAVMHNIKKQGGVDFILHLAGYYDFTYEENPEYLRTNVNGTRHMLELAKWLCVRRFIFASSLAACEFPRATGPITERTPTDARYAYARSKRVGEEMAREYSRWFPCTVLRFAAVFSDWCEYAPLYAFLSTWLSDRLKARVLGGRGKSSVTYIHVRELCRLVHLVLRQSQRLPAFGLYCVSPNETTTHLELYELATRFYFGRIRSPIFVPKPIASAGVRMMDLAGRLVGRRPFERPWMMRYIDRQLVVDASYTNRELSWEPAARNSILRRVLFMIEKMKSSPGEWRLKNEAALKRVTIRPNLVIYEELASVKERIQARLAQEIRGGDPGSVFRHYLLFPQKELNRAISLFYDILMASVRTGSRQLLIDYLNNILPVRFAQGFGPEELIGFHSVLNDLLLAEARSNPRLRSLQQETHDAVTLTLQLAADEVEFSAERYHQAPEPGLPEPVDAYAKAATEELERMIIQLNIFYREPRGDEMEELIQVEDSLARRYGEKAANGGKEYER